MGLISEDIIRELGYQLAPNRDTMGTNTQITFKQLISNIMDKELKATKIEAITAEMIVIGEMLKEKICASTQHKLFERFHKLGKDIDKV